MQDAMASELPDLPDGHAWLVLAIPVDESRFVDADEVAETAADAARRAIERRLESVT